MAITKAAGSTYLSLASDTYYCRARDFTVMLWVRPTADPGADFNWHSIMGCWDAGVSNGWSLEWNGLLVFTFGWANAGSYSSYPTTGTALAINAWYHVAVAYNAAGGIWEQFVNGVQVRSVDETNTIPSVTGALRIGQNPDNATGIAGQLAYPRIFEGYLSAAEVREEMRSPIPVNRRVPCSLDIPLDDPGTSGIVAADRSHTAHHVQSVTGTVNWSMGPLDVPAAAVAAERRRRIMLWASTSAGGSVTLDGAGDTASSASADVALARPLDSVAPAASLAIGTLGASRPIGATTAAASSFTGLLAVGRAVTATLPAAADLGGALDRAAGLAGGLSAAAESTGGLAAARGLVADSAASAGLAGAAEVARTMAGPAPAAAFLAGDLSIGGEVAYAATAASAADFAAALTSARPLDGTTASAGGLSAEVGATRALAGAVAGSVSMDGDLTAESDSSLDGSVAAATHLAAILGIDRALTGAGAGAGSMGGEVQAVRDLVTAANTASWFLGSLTTTAPVTRGSMSHTQRPTTSMTHTDRTGAEMTPVTRPQASMAGVAG